MCVYLVRLDILDMGDAPYVLVNSVDARNAMDGRSLAIVHLLLSRREFDPDVVSQGRDIFVSRAILRGHMVVVDAYLDSWPERVPLMNSAGKMYKQLHFLVAISP
jgi:hypothetical protein